MKGLTLEKGFVRNYLNSTPRLGGEIFFLKKRSGIIFLISTLSF